MPSFKTTPEPGIITSELGNVPDGRLVRTFPGTRGVVVDCDMSPTGDEVSLEERIFICRRSLGTILMGVFKSLDPLQLQKRPRSVEPTNYLVDPGTIVEIL